MVNPKGLLCKSEGFITEVGSLQTLTPTLPGCCHRKPSPHILRQQNVGWKNACSLPKGKAPVVAQQNKEVSVPAAS